MPFVISALVVAHFMALHEHGNNNPMGISGKSNIIPFHVYFTSKDLVGYKPRKLLPICSISLLPTCCPPCSISLLPTGCANCVSNSSWL